MLKKILKVAGIIVGIIVVVIAEFYTKSYIAVHNRMDRTYTVTPQPVTVVKDSASLALGARLVKAKGCEDCHSKDLGGKVFVDDAALGKIIARNLTKGKGGLPKEHGIEDWVLALKHGIRKDGKPLIIMPSHEFTLLSEQDMASIIAYATQLPEVDRELPETTLGPLGVVLTDLGKIDL